MTTATHGEIPEWTVPNRLRKARDLTGLDQEDFAKEIGVSRGTVSNYERGVEHYKRPVMLAWAMRSGVSVEWLSAGQQTAPHPINPPDEGQTNSNTVGYSQPLRLLPAA